MKALMCSPTWMVRPMRVIAYCTWLTQRLYRCLVLCSETAAAIGGVPSKENQVRTQSASQWNSRQTGETASIGLADPCTLRDETTDSLKVLHVISGSPAFRMRVQPDDLIEAIDDVPTKTLSGDEAFKRMAGNSGTVVQLSVRRGAKRLHVRV